MGCVILSYYNNFYYKCKNKLVIGNWESDIGNLLLVIRFYFLVISYENTALLMLVWKVSIGKQLRDW